LRLITEKVVITTASLGTSFFQLVRRCLKRCSQYLLEALTVLPQSPFSKHSLSNFTQPVGLGETGAKPALKRGASPFRAGRRSVV
jgi:hypothetical protein